MKKFFMFLVFTLMVTAGVFSQNRTDLTRSLQIYIEELFLAGDYLRAPIDVHSFMDRSWNVSIHIFPIRPEARNMVNQIKRLIDNGERIEIIFRFSRGEGIMGLNEFRMVTIDDGINYIILLGTGMI